MPLFFSGSILMVVAGMFDGIAAPIYRVYHDAAILADYAAGVTSSPYRAAGREHVTDEGGAGAVGELT